MAISRTFQRFISVITSFLLFFQPFIPVIPYATHPVFAQEETAGETLPADTVTPTETPSDTPAQIPTATPSETTIPTPTDTQEVTPTVTPVESPAPQLSDLPSATPTATPEIIGKNQDAGGKNGGAATQQATLVNPSASVPSVVQTAVGSCTEDAYGSNLNCTANDVSIANVTNIQVLDDGCKYPGDTVTFTATWEVQSTATQRYNIGLYFASQGQSSALNGSCAVSTLANAPVPPNYDFDGNACGDISSAGPVHPQITMTVSCIDPDGDNYLNLPYCTSWNQNVGENLSCSAPSSAIPGAPSKCNCQDGYQVPITVPHFASIEVRKSLSPSTDTGTFNLSIDGTDRASCVGNNGTTGSVTVAAGTNESPGATHTVSESVTGCGTTAASDYSSVISCVNRGLTTYHQGSPLTLSGTGPLTVGVVKDDDIVCTITNTRNKGTLRVVKYVINDNGGTKTASDFGFSVNGAASIPFESDGTNDLEVIPGTYTVTEPAAAGYTTTYDNCSGITVPSGGMAICTITNDDQPGTLIVRKVVINDNGGTLAADDFSFRVNGETAIPFEADGQNELTVHAGTYTVTEPVTFGYNTSYDQCAGMNVPNGGTRTCTITNNDAAATLTVIKHVINDNGGTASAANFTMTIHDVTAAGGNTFAGSETGVVKTLTSVGSYNVTESGPAGYGASYSQDCSGTIDLGENKTCTITNNDVQPRLTVIKHVVNDNGTLYSAPDFTMHVAGTNVSLPSFPGSESGTLVYLNAGTYAVSETGPAGFTPQYSAECTGSVAVGQVKTCTVTNDDQVATLTVVKHVINDDGGTLGASDFLMQVAGVNVSDPAFTGNESGTSVTLDAGTYAVTEIERTGYSATYSADCTGSITNGEAKTCTITNNDQPATLIVRKLVINDDGGTLNADDFGFTVNAGSVEPFETDGQNDLTLPAGTYTVREPSATGYHTSYSNCTDVVLTPGSTQTCTVTNDDIAPKLTVTKVVINDNGGTKTVADFPLFVGITPVSSGIEHSFPAQSYVVGETGQAGYTPSISGDCDASGNITLLPGDVKYCTITNNDQESTITLVKTVVNDNGGTAGPNDFNLSVDGVALVSGGTVIIDAGVHQAAEIQIPGYTSAGWAGDCAPDGSVTTVPGDHKTCTIVNDDTQATLTVIKQVINDNGGTAVSDDFTMHVTGTHVSLPSFAGSQAGTTVTLDGGSYDVSEDAHAAYAAAYSADCSGIISVGESRTCTVTNDDMYANLTVTKFRDDNSDGQKDADEPVLPGWDMTLTWGGQVSTTQTTGTDGTTVFTNLIPGVYILGETTKPGYELTAITCPAREYMTRENAAELVLDAEETVECFVGNRLLTPVLTVSKSNDAAVDKHPGDLVTFTLTVTATQSAAYNVTVTDLPPSGFTYQAGSWTAYSSLRGDLKSGGVTTEPTYHSPGVWQLGTMDIGDVVTLTYAARISDDQKPGTYKDLAWASGCRTDAACVVGDAMNVLAASTDPGIVTDTFVGTRVTVVRDRQSSAEITVDSQVLGASIELPATGVDTRWVLAALVLVATGVGTLIGERKMKKGK